MDQGGFWGRRRGRSASPPSAHSRLRAWNSGDRDVIRNESPEIEPTMETTGAGPVPTPPRLPPGLSLVAMLGAHTNWRRPELTGVSRKPKAPTRRQRLVGSERSLGALWGAPDPWAARHGRQLGASGSVGCPRLRAPVSRRKSQSVRRYVRADPRPAPPRRPVRVVTTAAAENLET